MRVHVLKAVLLIYKETVQELLHAKIVKVYARRKSNRKTLKSLGNLRSTVSCVRCKIRINPVAKRVVFLTIRLHRPGRRSRS